VVAWIAKGRRALKRRKHEWRLTGYYAWLQRPPSARATADAALLKRIKTVHACSRQTYGAPCVPADLHGHGERHGPKRIACLMREAGLVGASHRHGGPTTTRRGARCQAVLPGARFSESLDL
jgi:transposase InsO family protein